MADTQTTDGEENTDPFEALTGTQKSAILMMLLGEEEASEIIRNLSPKEVQHLGSAMYSVQGLDQDTVNKVLDEFLEIIKQQTSLGLGSDSYIRNVTNQGTWAQIRLSQFLDVSRRPAVIDQSKFWIGWMHAPLQRWCWTSIHRLFP